MSVSTSASVGSTAAFSAGLPYKLHPAVEIRPEPFGALLYSFKTRRLSFLKDLTLVTVVRSLADYPTATAACRGAGVSEPARLAAYFQALATLAGTETIRERHESD